MEGSRLVLISDSPSRAVPWRNALRDRMRARKWYQRYPLVDVEIAAIGSPQEQTHVDRLRKRALLNRGSVQIDIAWLGNQRIEEVPLESLKELLDLWLDEWAIYLDRAESVAHFDPTGWGALFPRILFVGDSSLHNELLSELLDAAQLEERELRFSTEPSLDAVRWIGARHVIALGRRASDYLRDAGVEYDVFHNPLVLKVFYAPSTKVKWGRQLKEMCSE